VNDIFDNISLFMRLFADDTTQMMSPYDLLNQYMEMQGDINQLFDWCKASLGRTPPTPYSDGPEHIWNHDVNRSDSSSLHGKQPISLYSFG
jgi:hypothetical protein